MNNLRRNNFFLCTAATVLLTFSCTNPKESMKLNHLAESSSPYLLQHAHQPVDWYPWGEEALAKAKSENKMLIISVGYSTCHWCHVMAHETFDDSIAADFMNTHFVSIKVDREERPDIDQVYMRAVQMMTGQGGWPLNVVALPDGRPVWGGTYFPKDRWIASLQRILDVREEDSAAVEDYAARLQEGVQLSSTLVATEESPKIDEELFHVMRHNWSRRWDSVEGGPDKAPKFPMPNNYLYLLRYGSKFQDQEALAHVKRTLDAMMRGGIYDQVGGGFTRYSTDAQWRVPHFEKMLYDNGQLLELYAEAYQVFKDPNYAELIHETVAFCERELQSNDGLFHSALDADTEGEEGKFYVWTSEEVRDLLQEDYEEFVDATDWNGRANWEHSNHVVLLKSGQDKPEHWNVWMNQLFEKREERTKPGVDTKKLLAWNALYLSGLVHSAQALQNEELMQKSIELGTLIKDKFLSNDELWHAYGDEGVYIPAFSDDYAITIKALVELNGLTGNVKWLTLATDLTEQALNHFHDDASPMLWYANSQERLLISSSHETEDNVIPAANSVFATQLFRLGRATGNSNWEERAIEMTQLALTNAERYPESYSQWAQAAMDIQQPSREVVVVGPDASKVLFEMGGHYLPNTIFLGTIGENQNPPFENRYLHERTRIFVCEERACQLPVESVAEALNLLPN